jgi:PKHD-type hydroxylase
VIFAFSDGPAPYNNPVLNHHFVQLPSGLSDEEIERIRVLGDSNPFCPVGVTINSTKERVNTKGCRVRLNDSTRWIYERMAAVVLAANEQNFRYDLTGLEVLYYMRYDAPDEHFGWHVDSGAHPPCPRKLSFSVQLSDPSEYDGGDFDVFGSTDPLRAERGKGLVTAFPAFKNHRVTPVTRGTRRALTVFACGPNFR